LKEEALYCAAWRTGFGRDCGFIVNVRYDVVSQEISSVIVIQLNFTDVPSRGWKSFKYLGTTLTNQNSIAEEIKSRLRSRNAFYLSVQNLLSSRLLSKNLKI